MAAGLRFQVQVFGLRAWSVGFRALGSGFRVYIGFRAGSFGFFSQSRVSEGIEVLRFLVLWAQGSSWEAELWIFWTSKPETCSAEGDVAIGF